MHSSPEGAALRVVPETSDPSQVADDLDELHHQVAASEEHIAKLQSELKEATDQEADTARQLDTERTQRAVLDQQLHQVRTEAARLMLDEATQTRNALVTEAEEHLETSRIEAEHEASKITKQTFDQAKEMLAEARREGAAIVDAGQEKLKALEADAAERVAALDTEHRELTQRLKVMETLYTELQETLQLVAETSVEQLAQTQESLKQLDPAETQGSPTEPTGEQTTPGPPPQDDPIAEREAPSNSAGAEPASIKIPPLTGH